MTEDRRDRREGYERRLAPSAAFETQGLVRIDTQEWSSLGTAELLKHEAAGYIQELLQLCERQDFKAGCYRITISALPQSVEDSRWKAGPKG